MEQTTFLQKGHSAVSVAPKLCKRLASTPESVLIVRTTFVPVTPHSPVAAIIREDIYQTRTLQQVVAPKWPLCDPVHKRVSWEEAQHIFRKEIKWQVTPCRDQDEMQEY